MQLASDTRLTSRQNEVLALMARGLTNGEIADALGISFSTAKTHVSDVIARLGVATREEAILAWRRERSPLRRARRAFRAVLPASLLVRAAAGVGAVAGATGVGVLFVAGQLPASQAPAPLVVPLSDLERGVPRSYIVDGLGRDPAGNPYPVWVVTHDDGTHDAVLGRDPLSGCAVSWVADYLYPSYHRALSTVLAGQPLAGFIGAFKADCSGAVFSIAGREVWGAAQRGLDGYRAERIGDNLVVTFDSARLGQCPDDRQSAGCSVPGRPASVAALPAPVITYWNRGCAASACETWPRRGNRNLWYEAWRIASPSQRPALADGEVSFGEYEAAALATVACVDRAGGIRGEAVFDAGTQTYQVAARGEFGPAPDQTLMARLATETADCYAAHWGGVAQAWSAQLEPTNDSLDQARSLLGACLREAGLPAPASHPAAGLSQFRGTEPWTRCLRSVQDLAGLPGFDG
jgi:DNA-binding CsgD family transcriptional regulator